MIWIYFYRFKNVTIRRKENALKLLAKRHSTDDGKMRRDAFLVATAHVGLSIFIRM